MLPKPKPAAGQIWRYKDVFGHEDTLCLLYREEKSLRILWFRGNSIKDEFYSISGQLAEQLTLDEGNYMYVGTLDGQLLVEKIKHLSETDND